MKFTAKTENKAQTGRVWEWRTHCYCLAQAAIAMADWQGWLTATAWPMLLQPGGLVGLAHCYCLAQAATAMAD